MRQVGDMKHIVAGQILLILCCGVYLVWWYRGFRPGEHVSRIGGVNGILLLITAGLGLAGAVLSLLPIPTVRDYWISPGSIAVIGVVAYIVLLFVTDFLFHRMVTTELILIVGWTMLEIVVADRLYAGGALGRGSLITVSLVIAAAFLISMVLYVAYYQMEEMKAFYAAMVPLVTEAAAMGILTGIVIAGR